ncbi:MAG TPA: hypothetical protein VIU12_08995 [Chryseolinea sp.]
MPSSPRAKGKPVPKKTAAAKPIPAAKEQPKADASTANGQPADQKKSTTTAQDTAGLIGYASNIVSKAANILEEEIAKGIVAARQLEGRFTDVDKVRDASHHELISRFRKDAHDIVDILMDVATVAVKNAANPGALFKLGSKNETEAPSESSSAKIPLIKIPGVLIPGQAAVELPLTLENDSKSEIKSIHFENTALMEPSGSQIAASAMKFEPNPLVIQPQSSGHVMISLSIPKKAKPGSYSCFVQARNMEQLKATVLVQVAEG